MTRCSTRKNVIYFSRSFNYEPPGQKWGDVVVNYSLTRLEPYVNRGNFDVVFFSNNKEKSDELWRNYPWLIIEPFDLIEYPEHVLDRCMHKWYNFTRLGGYEKMLYLDNDTYFNFDPSIIFDEYTDDFARGLFSARTDWTRSEKYFENLGVKKLSYNGRQFYPLCENTVIPLKNFHHLQTINSGALMFNKNHFQKAPKILNELEDVANLYNHEINDLIDRGIIERGSAHLEMLYSQSDESIGKLAFENLGIYWKSFDAKHVNINIEKQVTDSSVIHYVNSSRNINSIVPSEFISKYLGEAR